MIGEGILFACCVVALLGCMSMLNRIRAAEEHIRTLLTWWWKQAKPGMPIPHELQRRK